MTLDRKLETYRELYDEADDITRNSIDSAVNKLVNVLREGGFETAINDHLENLVTAVVKYLIESGNSL